MQKIRIGILGYGNIAKGTELAIKQNEDMELTAVFTRHKPEEIKIATESAKVVNVNDYKDHIDKIDVLVLCIGSAFDLGEFGPFYSKYFNTVDSYDTHAKIPEYFADIDKAAGESGHVAVISTGWDPGMFSLNRLYSESVLPVGDTYTFWGEGVSQGHSDAVRKIAGVKLGVQYTIPKESAVKSVRNGENPNLSVRDKHLRVCYIVAEDGADKERIKNEICSMPNYFADYDTEIRFITEETFKQNHTKMPHGGFVFRSGETASGNKHIIEYSLKLESNPEFTGNVLAAYARAAYRLSQAGEKGAKTVFDIPPALLSAESREELLKTIL